MSGSPDAPLRSGWESIHRRTLDCVHCGLCLPSCPTYRETGREVSSPRGRIYLMRGAAEGRIPVGDVLAEEAFLCLGCRACETACPSGVQYGALVEETREQLVGAGKRRGVARVVERLALRALVPHRRRLRLAFDALRLAQWLRLDRLAAPLLPAPLRHAPALLPAVPPRRERAPLPERVAPRGPARGRVGFFAGCVMPELFGSVNAATVQVLAANGFEVVVPRAQGCCGALQAHAGDGETARRLAAHNARVFAEADVDVVVTNSAGCGAAMRDAGHWLPQRGGVAFAAKVRDVCEWLDAEGLTAPLGPVPARVCYDDPCHLLHGQRVGAAPRRLLARIPGIELVPHRDPAACCGAAGTYNLTHPAMSQAVLARKLDALAEAAPDVVASGNPGCLMQLRAGIAARGLGIAVVHPVELLARAHAAAEAARAGPAAAPAAQATHS